MAPIKKYGPGDRLYVRAQQVWLILVAHIMAKQKQRERWQEKLITYGDLAERMGDDRRAAIGLGRELGIVGEYCIDNKLPAMNCIVVNQDDRKPGLGVVHRHGKSWDDEARATLEENWFQYRVPSTGTFREVIHGEE